MSVDNLTVTVYPQHKQFLEQIRWCKANAQEWDCCLGKSGSVNPVVWSSMERRKKRVAFAFTNDTDALLFKLTFSQYL
jgi:hypothetical protein